MMLDLIHTKRLLLVIVNELLDRVCIVDLFFLFFIFIHYFLLFSCVEMVVLIDEEIGQDQGAELGEMLIWLLHKDYDLFGWFE